MSDNGEKVKKIVSVTLEDGKMRVSFGAENMALISHAIRLASLNLDNAICQKEQENEENAIKVVNRLIH